MKKPSIRFQEFNDEWEVQSFGTYINECNELTSDKVKYPLYSLTIEEGVVPKPERYEREHLITKERDSYKIVPSNAFVYNPMNLRFGALKVNHENFPVCVSGYYNVFLMGNEETLKFWENYLLTDKMLNYYYSIATGSLIEKLRVHFSQFVNIKKPLPSLEEQKKISSLFNNIDDVISTIEAEIELWEEKKKGVMQKIFSQEVRFRKEDGSDYPEWKELLFMNIATLSKDKYNPNLNEQYQCIELDNIEQGTGRIKGYVISNKQSSIKNVFHMGDILFGKLRPYLRKYAKPDFDGVCSSEIWVLRPNKDVVCTEFLYYLVASDSFIAAANVSFGTKMPRADWKLVSNMYFGIPAFEEQQKIADCLSFIDKAVEIKKQKLETWKNIKRGLLQQMFV